MYNGRSGWLRLVAVIVAIGTLLRFGRDFRSGRLYW